MKVKYRFYTNLGIQSLAEKEAWFVRIPVVTVNGEKQWDNCENGCSSLESREGSCIGESMLNTICYLLARMHKNTFYVDSEKMCCNEIVLRALPLWPVLDTSLQ